MRLRCAVADARKLGLVELFCSIAVGRYWAVGEPSDWCLVVTRGRTAIFERLVRGGDFRVLTREVDLTDSRSVLSSSLLPNPFCARLYAWRSSVAHPLRIEANAGTEVTLWTKMLLFGRKGEWSAGRGDGVRDLYGQQVHQGVMDDSTIAGFSQHSRFFCFHGIVHLFFLFVFPFYLSFLFFSFSFCLFRKVRENRLVSWTAENYCLEA